ncbi:hypothetical protein B1400_0275 [Bifidobacterium italicum]|uniref:DUF6591 domain-containing protein n=1 Tax=Bifidobacterium italicum TaxID=1960968 RepID=A0A2A2ELY1_9BIFI|nr:DUF6591 domain-containing protein [Bifidobacterium italicum]PAU70081.1 hypothetical protein B1400_0275 [Bifidobacterium italicum]
METTEPQQTESKQPMLKKKIWIIAVVGVVAAALVAVGVIVALRLNAKGDAVAEAKPAASASQSAASGDEDGEKKKVTPSTTDPEQVMKNYEEFMTKYAYYAKLLNSQDGLPADEVDGYIEWNSQMEDILAQFEAVQDTELTPEQKKEFDAMLDRVDDMMVEATGSELVRTPRTAEEAEKLAEERKKAAEESRKALTGGSGSSDDESGSSSQTK